jgi:hypothetical protein
LNGLVVFVVDLCHHITKTTYQRLHHISKQTAEAKPSAEMSNNHCRCKILSR